MTDFLAHILGWAIITIVIFLICREIVMWYWKINEGITQRKRMIANQEKIISLLEKIKNTQNSKTRDDTDTN